MKNVEALIEIRNYVQACREEGETDLRSILCFINEKIKECDTVENEGDKP